MRRRRVAVFQQGEDGVLHVDIDALMNAVILQRSDHLQPGAIADVGEPRIFMTAKISLQNPAILRAIENRAPCFEFAHAIGRFLRVQLGHAPVVDVLAAAHGVGEMHFPIVAIIDIGQRRRDPAFRHHGVRFAEKRFANHARPKRPRPTLRSPRADPRRPRRLQDVVFVSFVIGHVSE